MTGRITYILNKLEEIGFLNVNEIAEELNVSSATIRRDFSQLEKQGKLKRVAGGAVKAPSHTFLTVDSDLSLNHKIQLNSNNKKLVCEMACEKIHDGDCIFIDAGTSSLHMFKILQNRHITIVTNNFLFVSQITPPIAARIIVVGGLYMADYALTYSSTAFQQLQSYNFNHCFITCAGINVQNGLVYSTETETRNLKSLVCNQSKHRHLLVDQSKLDIIGFCVLEQLSIFDTIFCDQKNDDGDYPDNFQFYR